MIGKKILLVNDLPGYGKVALATAMPLLSRMGHHIYNLPTALVSNTLDWGKFHILETTEYMVNTMKVWDELGFQFDAVSTGFLVSENQAKILAEYCRKLKEKGTLVFADPIMGDAGKLYNGITEMKIRHMKELVKVADYIVPNYTEAAYLAGVEYQEKGLTYEEVLHLVEKLKEVCGGSMIITSAKADGQTAVIVYDKEKDKVTILPFEEVQIRFPGTGDIFSALFMGNILDGKDVAESARTAMLAIETMIEEYQKLPENYKGIPVEQMLEKIELK